MDCGRFNKLIDSYLDGQLAGSLLAEFHAHRLACRRCSRVVDTLQAAGDVIAHDRSCEPKISSDFADRLLQSLPSVTQNNNRSLWLVRLMAGAGTLAAAAAIIMAVMLSNPVATHQPDHIILGSAAVADGIPVPEHAFDVQRMVLAQSDRLPTGNVLLTGNFVRGAVDQMVSWTDYRLGGHDQDR